MHLIWKDVATGQERSLKFDVVTSESYEALLAITEHPVETGASPADHARLEPRRIPIEAFVSNSPLSTNPGVLDYMGFNVVELPKPKLQDSSLTLDSYQAPDLTIVKLIPPFSVTPSYPKRAIGLTPNDGLPRNRVREMFEQLDEFQQKRTFLRVVLGYVELDNILLERVAISRTPDDGSGAVFQCDFHQVRVVSTQRVAKLPKPKEPRKPKVTAGTQAPQKSILAGGSDASGLTGLVGNLF